MLHICLLDLFDGLPFALFSSVVSATSILTFAVLHLFAQSLGFVQ
jgi:hypothetical protein